MHGTLQCAALEVLSLCAAQGDVSTYLGGLMSTIDTCVYSQDSRSLYSDKTCRMHLSPVWEITKRLMVGHH